MLAKSIPQLFTYDKITLVTSVMNDKPVDAMFDILIPLVDQIIVTKAHSSRALEPSELKEKIASKDAHLPIYIEEEPMEAVKKALSLSSEQDLVLISGSLYLIEDIRDEVMKLIDHRAGV